MNSNCWESSPKIPHSNNFVDINSEVVINDKTANITLNKDGLLWKDMDSDQSNIIKYQQIVNVKRSKKNSIICINYLNPSSCAIIKFKRFKIKFSSNSDSEKWSKKISKKLKSSFNRLKCLFIFVDKIANRCKINGLDIFEKRLKRFISDARISYVIKEIQSLKDIEENIQQCFEVLKSSDGIIIMSGDETASLIISRIINIFQNDEQLIKQVPIPFGILPIGYHNDISNAIWGSDNIENAFLNILLCLTFPVDILSVTSKESNSKRWGFNFHYGYSNIVEKYRIENEIDDSSPKKNNLMKKTLKIFGSVKCDVKYQLSNSSTGNPTTGNKCHINCTECNIQKLKVTNIPTFEVNSSVQLDSTDGEFIDVNDNNYENYSWIIVNSIPCAPEAGTHEITPYCHLNDHSADMVLVKSKNKKEFKIFLKYLNQDGTHLSLPFVSSVRVEKVNLIINSKSSQIKNNNELDKIEDLCIESNNVIIIEDKDSVSTSENDEQDIKKSNLASANPKDQSTNVNKKPHKLLKPIVKAYKEITKTTYANQSDNENYKKPNMFESDREKERKANKLKKKEEKLERDKPIWMLDYNFLSDFKCEINIKVYSGLISFFGNACNSF